MNKNLRDAIIIAVLIAGTMAVLIWVSNVVRVAHDEEIRQQTIQTCKEVK